MKRAIGLTIMAVLVVGCGAKAEPPASPPPGSHSPSPSPSTSPASPPAPDESELAPRVRGGAICGSPGKVGVSRDTGRRLVCRRASDGRNRWQSA